MKKEKKNSAVELWRFIFTVAIAIGHLNSIVWNNTNVNLIFNGYKFLAFFMFLSGYFLMCNYQKNKKENEKVDASVAAWRYTKKRISALYPALFGGVLLAFVVRNVIAETKLNEIFSVFMNSIFEFLGVSQLTISTSLWNSPLWYISALFLVGFILYYIVNKSEDFFRVFAVIFTLIVYSSLGLGDALGNSYVLGIQSNVLRLMAGMCMGMLLYYVVEYFKNKKFTENITMVISVLHIALAMMIIYFWVHGASWNNNVYDIILFIFTAILLIDKDYISVLYDDNEFCNSLGRLSLYYFVSHFAFIYLLQFLFPEMGYIPSIVFNILFSLSWAFIMLYIDEYVVSPIFRTKKDEKKASSKRVVKKAS